MVICAGIAPSLKTKAGTIDDNGLDSKVFNGPIESLPFRRLVELIQWLHLHNIWSVM